MSRKGAQAGVETVKRVLLVDDHPMMREGLAQLINHEQDLEVCGEVESAVQALEAADRFKPDLVLVDISLPDRSGLELIKDLHLRHPAALVLVISMHDENVYA